MSQNRVRHTHILGYYHFNRSTYLVDFADDLTEDLSSDSFKEMASETVEGVPGGLRRGDGDSASSH